MLIAEEVWLEQIQNLEKKVQRLERDKVDLQNTIDSQANHIQNNSIRIALLKLSSVAFIKTKLQQLEEYQKSNRESTALIEKMNEDMCQLRELNEELTENVAKVDPPEGVKFQTKSTIGALEKLMESKDQRLKELERISRFQEGEVRNLTSIHKKELEKLQ